MQLSRPQPGASENRKPAIRLAFETGTNVMNKHLSMIFAASAIALTAGCVNHGNAVALNAGVAPAVYDGFMMTIMARTMTATGAMTASFIIRTVSVASAATMETISATKVRTASMAFTPAASPGLAGALGLAVATALGPVAAAEEGEY
jgi:hypothetical protein